MLHNSLAGQSVFLPRAPFSIPSRNGDNSVWKPAIGKDTGNDVFGFDACLGHVKFLHGTGTVHRSALVLDMRAQVPGREEAPPEPDPVPQVLELAVPAAVSASLP